MSTATQTKKYSKAFRSRATMIEMLGDRGYVLPSDTPRPASLDEFKHNLTLSTTNEILYDSCTLVGQHKDNGPSDIIVVFFDGDEKINTIKIRGYWIKAAEQNARSMIIVHVGHVNPAARKFAVELARNEEKPIKTQFFDQDDVVINITKHELVPQHEPLTQAQADEVLANHNVQLAQLPRILLRDPQVQYFGLERGRVVKITRSSETAGQYVTYRQVV